ncbi:putative iron-sulfur protein [Corynebacterium diphtheriae]|nr:putative iron-sulfur protein [Corynebacterium diphtheriae]
MWNMITRMVFMGRIMGGSNGKITHLPSFLAGWTDVRDTAVPPKKSFRQWFETEEAQQLLADARRDGIHPNNPEVNQKKEN